MLQSVQKTLLIQTEPHTVTIIIVILHNHYHHYHHLHTVILGHHHNGLSIINGNHNLSF